MTALQRRTEIRWPLWASDTNSKFSGFFKRAAYFRTMPKYQGVKICKKEQYQVNQGFLIVDSTNNKKHWITNWTEKKKYY